MTNRVFNLFNLLVVILICLTAGFLGSRFIAPSIPNWYDTLQKPFFTPPSWVFAPVWAVLYVLMGAAAFLIWRENENNRRREALILFSIQLVLNAVWSVAFFGLKSPSAGLSIILILCFTLACTVRAFFKISRKAGLLMLPYLAWIGFATLLNATILVMNFN